MSEFIEIKGNCSDRLEINGVDHCNYHTDDCEESCCPHMADSALTVGSPGDDM